ncbi:MAG: AMP-binding protein, partial [bacterium]
MNVAEKQKIRELIELVGSKNQAFNKDNLQAILTPASFEEPELDRLIDSTEVKDFLSLGTFLLQEYEKCKDSLKQPYREILFRFLDFARTNQLLKKIYKNNKGNAWFDLLLSILKKTNFTTGQLFRQRVQRYGDKTLFKLIKEHNIEEYSWNEVQEKVDEIARSLFALAPDGILSGPVAILSENTVEMALIDLACLSTGIVNVLIAANSLPAQVEYILRHSEAKTIFVSDEKQLNTVLKLRSQTSNLQNIVIIEDLHSEVDDSVISYGKFLNNGKHVPLQDVQQAVQRTKLEDLASVMYTSGTTEAPKGIMFSHLNIVSKRFARAIALPEIGEHDTFLCFLPLFHTFGRWFEMLGCVFWGSTYAFMQNPSIETVID